MQSPAFAALLNRKFRLLAAACILVYALPAHAQEHQRMDEALLVLHTSFVFLEAYDMRSTIDVIRAGGSERNLVMRPVVTKPVVFAGLKLGLVLGTVRGTREIARRGHRRQAIVTMVVANGLMAAVAINNAQQQAKTRRH